MAGLRKIKDNVKKVVRKKTKTSMVKRSRLVKKAAGVVKTASKTAVAPVSADVILGLQEMAVEQTKFSHPEVNKTNKIMPQELPHRYGRDRLVILVRDTHWIYAFWEVTESTLNRFRSELGNEFNKSRRILRVYDVSNILFDGTNAHSYFDIDVNDYADNWYINTQGPGKSWCVDYGLLLPGGRFVTILRSNVVTMPLDGPSWITDEEWMIPEDMFARIYGMSFGFGTSSPVGKAWQERIKKNLFSGALISSGSPVRKKAQERDFWLKVDCELIVFGATKPDAKVYIQNQPINLRPDGTFTLRFALPDGKQVIPVKAVSKDKLDERSVTPIVTRETK